MTHAKTKTTTPTPTTCDRCQTTITRKPNSIGTGYGEDADGAIVCYSCCGIEDADHLNAMKVGDRAIFYVTRSEVDNDAKPGTIAHDRTPAYRYHLINWPSTLKIQISRPSKSWHNFAGKDGRRDHWFSYRGKQYHGVNIGDNDILRVRRLKDEG